MGRFCKEPWCGQPARGRGLCVKHYGKWYRTAGKKVAGNPDNVQLAREAMPGTYEQIAVKLEIHYQTAFVIVRRLHLAGEVHIADHQPPQKNGDQWQAIFADGPGVDHVVSDEARRVHYRNMKNRNQAANKERKRKERERQAYKPDFGALLDPLGL